MVLDLVLVARVEAQSVLGPVGALGAAQLEVSTDAQQHVAHAPRDLCQVVLLGQR